MILKRINYKLSPSLYKRFLRLLLLFGFSLQLLFLTGCSREESAARNRATNQPASNAASDKAAQPSPANKDLPKIVAFGNSLTAGYGLEPSQVYPALLQKRLEERGYRYRVINAGISGDTSAGGVRRMDWVFDDNVKFVILELGANDGLRGLSVSEMKRNLGQIIERAQKLNATVILAGMEAPPNYGQEYTREFRNAFPELAGKYNVRLIPFFLDGVAGKPELNLADGIHPNEEGTRIVLENVWRVLEPLLEQ